MRRTIHIAMPSTGSGRWKYALSWCHIVPSPVRAGFVKNWPYELPTGPPSSAESAALTSGLKSSERNSRLITAGVAMYIISPLPSPSAPVYMSYSSSERLNSRTVRCIAATSRASKKPCLTSTPAFLYAAASAALMALPSPSMIAGGGISLPEPDVPGHPNSVAQRLVSAR